MRLDKYLTDNGYFESRTKATYEIKEGNVLVDGKPILKPNYDYLTGIIEIIDKMPYVSRGGFKLEGAIKDFNLDFTDKVVLDIGSSTGGFTDCALKYGAKLVYSVDVGSDQLHHSLRENEKVIVMENTNILDANIDDNIDVLVMDVSFVSIKVLLPGILKYLNDSNYLVCLIKPQFEYGKMVNKGIIKEKKIHLEVLNKVKDYLNQAGLYINKLAPSPIKGGSGNVEFISIVSRNEKGYIDYLKVVESAHKKGISA